MTNGIWIAIMVIGAVAVLANNAGERRPILDYIWLIIFIIGVAAIWGGR